MLIPDMKMELQSHENAEVKIFARNNRFTN